MNSSFLQEKPKTGQQQGAPLPDAKSVDSEASVANKEEVDDDNKVEEAEVLKKELVGQAAPLVDVSGKNSNGKVNMFILVSYDCHCFCKAKVNIYVSIITLIWFFSPLFC